MERFQRRALLLSVFAGMTMTAMGARAQDRSQGRSMVISRGGIVAAGSPLAAEVGGGEFESGGEVGGTADSDGWMVGGVGVWVEWHRGEGLCVTVSDAEGVVIVGESV